MFIQDPFLCCKYAQSECSSEEAAVNSLQGHLWYIMRVCAYRNYFSTQVWISNERYPWLSLALPLLQPALEVVCRAAPTWWLGKPEQNKVKGAKKDSFEYITRQTWLLLQDSCSCHWVSLKREWEKMRDAQGKEPAAAPCTLHVLNTVHLGAPSGIVCLHLGHNTGQLRCTFPLQLCSTTNTNAFIPGTVWDLMTLFQKILREQKSPTLF